MNFAGPTHLRILYLYALLNRAVIDSITARLLLFINWIFGN
jgi:hypothetical protein